MSITGETWTTLDAALRVGMRWFKIGVDAGRSEGEERAWSRVVANGMSREGRR